MSSYTLRTTVPKPYAATVEAVRQALGDAGFGVLTEIDLKATLKAKLDVDVAPQIILGACRPQLAHEALQADASVAALLPCNVVVRSESEELTVVEAFDPAVMTSLMAGDIVSDFAADARSRLISALKALDGTSAPPAAGTDLSPGAVAHD